MKSKKRQLKHALKGSIFHDFYILMTKQEI